MLALRISLDRQTTRGDATTYVRKPWIVIAAYKAAASFAVGVGMGLAMVAVAAVSLQDGQHKPLHAGPAFGLFVAMLVLVSVTSLVIQLISGPFVFTRDVICKRCHRRFQARRIPFFCGRYSRPPKCECGGKFEPAVLWKRER